MILDTDWDSIVWRSGDDERMRRVLHAWDEHLADPYLPRRLPELLAGSGFALTAANVLPLLNIGFGKDTYSNGLIGLVSAFVAGRHGIDDEEIESWADDLRSMGDGYFFSLNRYVFVATAS